MTCLSLRSIVYAVLVMCSIGLFTTYSFAQNEAASFEQISHRCRQLLLSDTAYATEQSYRVTDDVIYDKDAKGYYESLTAEGKWDDLQYEGQMRSAWRASWHLYRTMLICRLYYQTNKAVYLQAVHNALAYWIAHDFKADNWWQNNINVPYTYSSLMIMLGKDTLPAEMKFYNEVIVKRIPIRNATGQNLLWQLDNEARAAILHKDEAAFKNVILRMQEVIEVTAKEGIQPDYSFHQHGPMLQFGNYGLHFLNTLVFWMSIAEHTPFAFAKEKKQVLVDYCSNGLRWSVYRGAMDATAAGRQLRNNYTVKRGVVLHDNFNLLRSLGNGQFCLNGFTNDKTCLPAGNKAFWRSDYMVDMKGERMMSVKMHGPYVLKVESINSENLEGAFLNDGVCRVQRTGNEYLNIEPLLNWTMLPGITCDTTIDPSNSKVFSTKNNGGFTGMVSDSSSGVAAMQYDRLGIHGYKSYFFIDNMTVALGAAIDTGRNIVTTINQRLTNKRQVMSGKTGNNNWLWHDSTAYIIPGQNNLHINTAFKSANWKTIDGASDKVVADTVLSIFLDHRTANKYAYIIQPNVSAKDAKNNSTRLPVDILANTASVQAVRSGNIIQAVFYSNGSLSITPASVIKVSQPCIIIYKPAQHAIWVADPTRKLASVSIAVAGKVADITLPSGMYAGSTVKYLL
ncbi:MAG: hypothetical protein J0I41_22880 [Filimonas sp.]|nr:hypothetical protein [Filimonas sp.]